MSLFRRKQNPEKLDHKLVSSLSKSRVPRIKALRLLPSLLKARELWILRIAIAVVLVIAAGFLTRFVVLHLEPLPRQGGTYREALVGRPYLINPVLAVSDTDKDLSRLIYPALLKYNEKGALSGDLAETFTIEEDGRAARFTLKDGIYWHDGQPLTFEDVSFTIASIRNPLWRSPLWKSFQDITVEVIDERTGIVRSSAFVSGFIHLFTQGIIPKHVWEQVDPQVVRLAVWNTKPIGAGPFRFRSLSKTQEGIVASYRLEQYNEYHGDAPFIRELILQFYPDFESALTAFKSQQVDGISFIPERLRATVAKSGTRVDIAEFPRFITIFFQERRSGVLKDKSVRRALTLMLAREQIAARVPDARVLSTPFLPDQIGYVKTIASPEYNLDEARALLKGAGWSEQDGGWIKGENVLRLTLTVPDEATMVAVAAAVKTAWEQLGVKVTLEAVSRGALESEILRPRVFEALLFSMVTGADSDPYPFWHSSQMDDPGLNLSSVKSRAIDLALEQGRSSADPAARLNAYIDFQKAFYEEVPGVVLYQAPYIYLRNRRVQAPKIERLNTPADRFNTLERWALRSRPGWR